MTSSFVNDRDISVMSVQNLAVAAPARTLTEIFDATASRWGDRTALDAPDAVLSYAQLADDVDALAARLASIGVGSGDRVGVHIASGTAALYVAILGVLASGAAYVPVDADDPAARVESIWRAAGVCAVIADELVISERLRPRGSGRTGSPDDDAWVIFTSGSTGAPKAVAVTHGAAAAFVEAETQLWTVTEQDRVLAGLSVGFDASCEEMWLAWRAGAALVPAPRAIVRSGTDLGPWLAERAVSVVSTVPTLAAMWDDDAIAGVRLLILGGEACPPELGWRLAAGREVWNTYGPTEATVVSTAAPIRADEPILIGRPLDGWQVAVLDESGEPVAFGDPGELVIGGVGLGRYLDPELDAERFARADALGWDRAYRTGDIVREWVDGYKFVGRRDDQVKVAGRRIELGEIESQLRAIEGVTGAAAAVRKTAGGNSVLVGYVTGAVDPAGAREQVAARLPQGLVPLIVVLDELPIARSGKLLRSALPWPPPPAASATADPATAAQLDGTERWLAGLWADQLGVAPTRRDDDFFQMGGTSVAAAKLVSVVRGRFPAAGVADIYHHPRLGGLAERLDQLGNGGTRRTHARTPSGSRWGAVQLIGVLALVAMGAMQWLLGIVAFDRWQGSGIGSGIAWGWIICAWLLISSAPGRASIVLAARTVLLRNLRPGRYPRRGRLACRLWFVQRLAAMCHLDQLAGTPWALRYARICGAQIGDGARLGTLPPVGGLLRIGANATLEGEVDVHGWWVDGDEIVLGEIRIGAGARIGTRTTLMPGAVIGEGAEVDPGSVVTGFVPAGERWAGSPAAYAGPAGETWPTDPPPPSPRRTLWRAMYAVGLAVTSLLPLVAALPGLAILVALDPGVTTLRGSFGVLLVAAPLVAASYIASYALLSAALVRGVGRLLRPGWHGDDSGAVWALWFTEAVMAGTRGVLFPLYSSLYTKPWLRLIGVRVGRRTEVSTAVGVNRLATIGDTSFLADDVVFSVGRARGGWVELTQIEVGNRTFLGNSAILQSGTRVGDDSLVGALSSPPRRSAHGTSWLGLPALELPRIPDRPDRARTTHPPRHLVVVRAAMELARILLPTSVAVVLGLVVIHTLLQIGSAGGSLLLVAVAAPLVVLAASVGAVLLTVCLKWLVIGRYEVGEYPLWSVFIWRDELINSCHEQIAGAWLLELALGTSLMPVYLRAMGAEIGRDVWFETMSVTEFDLVHIEDGSAVNRGAVVETHLFHDRLMRTGPATLGPASTLGPHSAVFPDTTLGARSSVGARSFVMRGEQLPPDTRWHGAPVVAA